MDGAGIGEVIAVAVAADNEANKGDAAVAGGRRGWSCRAKQASCVVSAGDVLPNRGQIRPGYFLLWVFLARVG